MKAKYIIYTLLIFGFGALVFYRISQGKSKEKGSTPGGGAPASGGPGGAKGSVAMPPVQVNGVVVKHANFANSLAVSGSVEANEQVQIRSEVQGIVREISFKEGSNVSKGQVLFRIDDSELQAQLTQALAKQRLAKENENRAKLLLQKEAISQEEYDVAFADLRSFQAQTQLIRAQIAKTRLRAPFSGKIGLRAISAGEYLTPATVVANLMSINPVKITFSVPEKYSGEVKQGSEITFSVAGSDKKHSAQVYAIEPGISQSTRTLQLRARAQNSSGELLPGAFAKVELNLSNVKDAILVPSEAVIPVLKGRKVFVVENGKAKEVQVKTGPRTNKDVLIESGIKVGDTVITSGTMSLKADAPVVVQVQKQ